MDQISVPVVRRFMETLVTVTGWLLLLVFAKSSASCPTGWYLGEGIRPSGWFACFSPMARNCGEAKGPFEHVPCPPQTATYSRIHCTNGTGPIVVNEHVVGCQRNPP